MSKAEFKQLKAAQVVLLARNATKSATLEIARQVPCGVLFYPNDSPANTSGPAVRLEQLPAGTRLTAEHLTGMGTQLNDWVSSVTNGRV